MEDTHVHALDYLSVFRRRKWWLIVPIALSVVVGLLLLLLLPKEYASSATLGVSASSVSQNVVNSQSDLTNEERLRAVSQQLLSSELLTRVAKEEGIPIKNGDATVTRMRKSIAVTVPEPVAQTNEPRRIDSFVVTYSDNDPARSQRVANRLANDFVDVNSRAQTARAEDTSSFLAAQLKASQARLADLESRLRRAKESHMGQLPEQTQANLQTLSGLRQQLEANAMALRSEQDRLSMLDRQLEGLRQGATDVVIMPRPGETAQTPESRVMSLERELAAARGMYTEKHPEVVRLKEELAAARRDANAERQRPSADRLAQLQLDPAYRQLSGDREMGRMRVKELERQQTDIQRQIGSYQSRVESAPMVEQQLASLQRDFDLEKAQYADLSSKLHAATIAESVARNRQGEQFTVLYPATFPAEPTKPIPMRVMLLSIVAGIMLGAALTLGREYLDRSVYDVRDLRDEFDLPVLGEVARLHA